MGLVGVVETHKSLCFILELVRLRKQTDKSWFSIMCEVFGRNLCSGMPMCWPSACAVTGWGNIYNEA